MEQPAVEGHGMALQRRKKQPESQRGVAGESSMAILLNYSVAIGAEENFNQFYGSC
jgi:hypothetical protein